MGYDMSLEQTPADVAGQKATHDRAEARWFAAMTKHGTDSIEAGKAFTAYQAHEDPTYFRLNIFHMGTYITFMKQFNMIAYHYDFEWSEARIDAPIAGEEPGIPIHKLGSNDGWLVRPEECSSALKAYEQFTRKEVLSVVSEDGEEYWDKWINFIRRAAENGGFRVY